MDSRETALDQTDVDDDGVRAPRATLVIYLGEGDSTSSTVVEIFDGAEFGIGRARSSTIWIDSEKVSRSHATIRRRADHIQIEDLGSRNGTSVNGKRVTGTTKLQPGDQIEIGPATCVLNVVTAMREPSRIGTMEHLEQHLAAEVDRGARYGRPFALVMLRLEGPDAACDKSASRVAASLREMDVIAEYGPDELAIVLPELDAGAAEQAAASLSHLARGASIDVKAVTVRVGVAIFPLHGARPGELISSAQEALRRSGTASNHIAVATDRPGSTPAAAVVCDPQMERVYSLVRKVADRKLTVLVVGETGVGKEMVAEAVHASSQRASRPFVRLNCACLPENLLESELFGHERGAFTGADKRKIGYFEAASGGTLFLDEIGEITPALQAKLLRVLEVQRLIRVGGVDEISVDARVVCATNRDLAAEVSAGRFREDLYYRISAFAIVVPPLRDRRSEIVPLARRFLTTMADDTGDQPPLLSPEAEQALLAHSWPGNVRELRNAIERAAVLQGRGVIEVAHLPDRVRAGSGQKSGHELRDQLEEVERASIFAALDECDGNQTHAARKLGISRRTLIYRMEKYGIKPPPASVARKR